MDTILRLKQLTGRYWWIPLLTGLVAIGLGVWLLCDPSQSLEVLAYVFAWCLIGAGIFNCSYSIMARHPLSNWGWALALGLLEIVCGVWMIWLPAAAVVSAFIFICGIWILVSAINSICESIALSAISPAWTFLMVLILCAVIFFAIVFLSNPITGAVAVWLYLGLSFILFGAYRVALAFSLKRFSKL